MKRKILIAVFLFIASIIGCGMLKINAFVQKTYASLDAVQSVDLQEVADGTYIGEQETSLVKVTVEVTVENHTIQDIQLIRHENGKSTPAEAILSEMIRMNTPDVDAVSGATMSSKTIIAAVRNALPLGTG